MDLNLEKEIRATIVAIDEQILAVKHQAEAQGVNPFEMRDMNGAWPLASLLAPRAVLLAALVQMKPQTIINNAAPSRGRW